MMEYDKSLQRGKCDSHDSLKGLGSAEIDKMATKDLSKANLTSLSGANCLRIGSVKKLPSAIEVSQETLSLLSKARDDLKKQEASRVQDATKHANQCEENIFDMRQINKLVEMTLNNSTASASKTLNAVGYHKHNQGESFENPQVVTLVHNKPLKPKWFEHDDRLRDEVDQETDVNLNVGKITKSSHEVANRFEHDLYETSQAYRDDFSGYSKQLVRDRSMQNVEKKIPMEKSEIVDRWGHDLYDATEQTPKSDKEFLDFYGYERRQINSFSAQRYNRGGPNKYRSSFGEGAKCAYSRPFRGRGGTVRFQPRTEDQVKFQKDEMSALNRNMKSFYL